MTQIALFHSALGVRPGVLDAAARLRAAGHEVLVVDQYDGRVFDDHPEASAFVAGLGFPALMQVAVEAVAPLADGFVAMGFSNGGGMAEHVATQRAVAGVVTVSGALPLAMLGASWPAGVPAQLHYVAGDPRRPPGHVETLTEEIRSAGGEVGVFKYPGAGHLFTDPSIPADYDPAATELLWERVLEFCR